MWVHVGKAQNADGRFFPNSSPGHLWSSYHVLALGTGRAPGTGKKKKTTQQTERGLEIKPFEHSPSRSALPDELEATPRRDRSKFSKVTGGGGEACIEPLQYNSPFCLSLPLAIFVAPRTDASLVASYNCPDRGVNPQPWHIGTMLQPIKLPGQGLW